MQIAPIDRFFSWKQNITIVLALTIAFSPLTSAAEQPAPLTEDAQATGAFTCSSLQTKLTKVSKDITEDIQKTQSLNFQRISRAKADSLMKEFTIAQEKKVEQYMKFTKNAINIQNGSNASYGILLQQLNQRIDSLEVKLNTRKQEAVKELRDNATKAYKEYESKHFSTLKSEYISKASKRKNELTSLTATVKSECARGVSASRLSQLGQQYTATMKGWQADSKAVAATAASKANSVFATKRKAIEKSVITDQETMVRSTIQYFLERPSDYYVPAESIYKQAEAVFTSSGKDDIDRGVYAPPEVTYALTTALTVGMLGVGIGAIISPIALVELPFGLEAATAEAGRYAANSYIADIGRKNEWW